MGNQIRSVKKYLATFVLLTAFQFTRADTLAEWTFETSHPQGGRASGVWFTNVAAEVGSGTAAGLHSGVAVYSVGTGNGSPFSFGVSNSWAVGDLYQFAVSTTGQQNVQVSFDQVSSSKGPGTFYLAYSIDGSTFTKFGSDYSVVAGNWSSIVPTSVNSFSFDLSPVTSINGQSTVYFRVVDDSTVASGGGAVMAVGNDRIDNFLVSAQPVPEPSVMTLTVFGGILSLFFLKRKI